MNGNRLSPSISRALEAGATLLVPSVQRQAALRAQWSELQRDAGHVLWATPRVLTLAQFCERQLSEQWAQRDLPDRLLPSGAEWAALRELRRSAGGIAEARALLNSIRTLYDWRMPRTVAALGASPEAELLHEALLCLERLSKDGRRPLRAWLDELEPAQEPLFAAGFGVLPTAQSGVLQRLGAKQLDAAPGDSPVAIAQAENDEHELELITAWCRANLTRDPDCRLLIVDARLRQRRRLYERVLSQALSPSEWIGSEPRKASLVFAMEGGRPLAEFPLIGHALLSLRLLTGRLRFDEIVHWLRQPFADGEDLMAGAAVEATLRSGRKLEYSAEELAHFLERSETQAAAGLAARLRQSIAMLSGERRAPAEWAPRILSALRQLGWHGGRTLRSDEQQTVTRWHGLLDEFSALGAWLTRGSAADAVATLADMAAERNFDPASVEAPVTLTESQDHPLVRYDGIWVAGLDAAQWPAPPRPDVFIPLRLQTAAGVPWASAAGQTRAARTALAAWRASTDQLHCSWARLEGDAHRVVSPLLARLDAQLPYKSSIVVPLAQALHQPAVEFIEDIAGVRMDTSVPVAGGVKPLTLQGECGFHAYGEVRLGATELEAPAPGIDARERGMLLHKALELVWTNLDLQHFSLIATDEQVRRPMIANAVAAAVVHVFRGHVPVELRPAVDRETHRIELLIKNLLEVERTRASFVIEALEVRRAVSIAGGQFEFRVDRIDFIEGGGYAILDYKSGESRPLRWQGETPRDPQLLAYLLAERGRNVQALANVSLTSGRAKFVGKTSRKGLLPGIAGLPGMNPNKVPAEQIEAAWQGEIQRWLGGLHELAAAYIAGRAPVQPAADVCRHCHLTTLCRRMELAAAGLARADDEHE